MSDTAAWMDENECACLLKMSVHFLRKDRQTHRLVPFIKLGSSVRYSRPRVEAAMLALETGGQPRPKRRGPGQSR